VKSAHPKNCTECYTHPNHLSVFIVGNSARWAKRLLWAWSIRSGNSMGSVWCRSALCKTWDTDCVSSMSFFVAALPHVTVEQLLSTPAGVGVWWLFTTDCWGADSASVLQRTTSKDDKAGHLYYWRILAALFSRCWVLESSLKAVVSACQSDDPSEWHSCLPGERATWFLLYICHVLYATCKPVPFALHVSMSCLCYMHAVDILTSYTAAQ